MAEYYAETNNGSMDIHYSREDGTEINWMITDLEDDSAGTTARYILYGGMMALGVLTEERNSWIIKTHIDDSASISVGIPETLAEDIMDQAESNGMMG